jgi:hypothetical protein
LLSQVALSQIPKIGTANIYSYDSSYVVTVKGEGYGGPLQIILKNKENRQQWQRKENIDIPPIVSNLGDVAINLNKFVFYDKKGKMIGSFLPDQPNETYWSRPGMADFYPVYAYSYNGQSFYTILTDEKDNELVSITRNGVERWRVLLPKNSIFSYHIDVFEGGSLINNYRLSGGGRRRYRNFCCLVNDSGDIVASYETHLRDSWPPRIDNIKKEFSLLEGDSIKTYSCISGSLIKTISMQLK